MIELFKIHDVENAVGHMEILFSDPDVIAAAGGSIASYTRAKLLKAVEYSRANPDDAYFGILVDGGAFAGVIFLRPVTRRDRWYTAFPRWRRPRIDPRIDKIVSMYILHNERGRGTGTSVLRMIATLVDRGDIVSDNLFVSTFRENEAMIRSASAAGFSPVSENGEDMQTVVLARKRVRT